MKKQQKWIVGFTFLLIMALALVACGGGTAEEPVEEAAPVEEAPAEEAAPAEEEVEAPAEEMAESAATLSLWYHGAGNPEEREVILQIIDDFNASQGDYMVEIEEFPQASYNESIVAAALAGDLPDIIDMDPAVVGRTVLADIGVEQVILDRYKMPGGKERAYTTALAEAIFGGDEPIYEDERITVYGVTAPAAPEPYLVLGEKLGRFQGELDLDTEILDLAAVQWPDGLDAALAAHAEAGDLADDDVPVVIAIEVASEADGIAQVAHTLVQVFQGSESLPDEGEGDDEGGGGQDDGNA